MWILILSSCSTSQPLKREPREKPKEIYEKSIVLNKYRAASVFKETIAGSGRVTLSQGEKRFHFDYSMAAKHPHWSRFEALSKLGQTLGILVTDRDQSSYYDPQSSKTYRDKSFIPHIQSYIPYDIHKNDFVGLLLNYVEIPLHLSSDFQFNEKFNVYEFSFVKRGENWHVFIDPFHFHVSDVFVYDEEHDLIFNISYYQFKKLESGEFFPRAFTFEWYGKDAAIWTFHFEDLSFMTHVSPKLFKTDD